MASSDDEDERLTVVVSDYSFSDGNDEPISFSELRMLWDEADSLEGSVEKIDLYGTTDNGLQKIFEQVIAWKFDLSYVKPEIFVLSQKKKWLKLLKPRKSFEEKIRTVLITVHFLHFVKRNPDATGKALWEYLSKSFSHYEPRPSEVDLVDHYNLINEAVKRDEVLAKSQVLIRFIEDKPKRKKVFDEEIGSKSISAFIDDDVIEEDGDGSDNEEDFYDHVCALCDNGGDILPCEGKCLRSFHATETAGAESGCDSLGYTEEQLKAIGTFECKNCLYKQHQCYCCGKLGSSDKLAGAQVFQCVAGTCGYFYHPKCVAEALRFKYGDESKDREAEYAAGNTFMCPLHFCYACKEIEPENVTDLQMQFAVCRRCPKAYHRKCMPRAIAFEEEGKDNLVRAWEDLMPNKILMYCLKHEIDDELETPVRDHIVFPGTDQKKKKKHILESIPEARTLAKKRPYSPEGSKKTSVAKPFKDDGKLSVSNKKDNAFSREGKSSVPDISRKPKLLNKTKVVVKKKISGVEEDDADNSSAIGAKLYALVRPMSNNLEKRVNSISKEQTSREKPVIKEKDDSVILDDESKNRIDSIMKETETLIGLEDVKRKHTAPSTHVYSAKYTPQNITLGKIEGLIEAIKAALQKLEKGGSLEDAKALCKPGLLPEIVRWKGKLKVYLSPFLYGMRYTSFGRHFTKVDKLEAIVDKLHYYVKEGDTVVDFCCGANDFSCLMSKKLDEVGKKCSYKNYDILQAKNDFNFEKKDWMSVQIRDLPDGKNLIIGLNPPFGVNASLANKFIDKALSFRPKLVILIVPPETERLDEKKQSYDLVWEDNDLLSGKAFYLPGSIDSSDKRMEDWNLTAPPLSLWSRSDWTSKHKAIAEKNGHLSCKNEPRLDKDTDDFVPQSSNLENGINVTNTGTEASQDKDNITLEKVNEGSKKKRKKGSAEEKPSEERSVPKHLPLSKKSGDRSASGSLGKAPINNDVMPEKGSSGDSKRRRGSEEKSPKEKRSFVQHSSPNTYIPKPHRMAEDHHPLIDPEHSTPNTYIPKPHRLIEDHHQIIDHEIRSRAQPHQGYTGYEGVVNTRMSNYSEEQYTRYNVEDQIHRGYDNSYLGRSNETYRIDTDLIQGAPAPLYGRQDHPDPIHYRDIYASANPRFAGHLRPTVESSLYGRSMVESSSYGLPAPSSAYSSSSTLQRYAPRLDELNPRRTAISDSSGGLIYNSTPHGVPNESLGGFAPAPGHTYSRRSSAGWLND